MGFTDPVTVTGTPQLGLTIGTQTRQATYDDAGEFEDGHEVLGLAPGAVLVFIYTVQETDLDADGISIAANALSLNGGTISSAVPVIPPPPPRSRMLRSPGIRPTRLMAAGAVRIPAAAILSRVCGWALSGSRGRQRAGRRTGSANRFKPP